MYERIEDRNDNDSVKYTYQSHIERFKDRPEMRNIPAYLQEFIRTNSNAINFIKRTLDNSTHDTGPLGRIFNDLPSLDTKNSEDFAKEYLSEIKKGNFSEYTLRKISDLLYELVDCAQFDVDGQQPNPHYGILNETLLQLFVQITNQSSKEILNKLYDNPIDPAKVRLITNQMITSLMIALSSRFSDILHEAQNENYPYKEMRDYSHLVSGFKIDEKGNAEAVEGATFRTLQALNFDQLIQRRELTPNNLSPNQALTHFVEHLSNVHALWVTNEYIPDEIRKALDNTHSNADFLLKTPNAYVAHDYVSQRKAMLGELIDEKIGGERKKLEGTANNNKSFLRQLGLYSKKNIQQEYVNNRIEALIGLKNHLVDGVEPAPKPGQRI